MVENVIYGQLDAYFTRCALFILLSEPKTSQVYIVKLLLEIMIRYLHITRNNSLNLFECA